MIQGGKGKNQCLKKEFKKRPRCLNGYLLSEVLKYYPPQQNSFQNYSNGRSDQSRMDGSQFKFVKFLGFLYMILDLILEQEKFEMAIIVPEFPVGHPWGVRPGHGEFEKVEGGSRDRGGHGFFNPVDGTDAAQVWIQSGLFTNSVIFSRLFTIKSH